METISKTEVLEYYRAAMFEKAAIERQIERLHVGGEPSGLRGAGLGHSISTNEKIAAAIQQWDGLEERLYRQIEECMRLAKDFWEIVNSIENGWERGIIIEYYANGLSDEKIADQMQSDRRHIWRVRHQILAEIERGETHGG